MNEPIRNPQQPLRRGHGRSAWKPHSLSFIASALLFLFYPAGNRAATAADPAAAKLLEEATRFFSEANQAALTDPGAARQLYRKATRRFHELTTTHRIDNPKLLNNQGNAAFLAGDLGEAIFAYRRATGLPGASRGLMRSLEHARRQVTGTLETPPENPLRRMANTIAAAPRPLWLAVIIVTWPLFFYLLYRILTNSPNFRSRSLRHASATATICLVAFLLLAKQSRNKSRPFGVLVAESTFARTGDASVYDAAFSSPLHPGIEFEPLRQRRGWIEARFADGTTAWIEEGTALLWPESP